MSYKKFFLFLIFILGILGLFLFSSISRAEILNLQIAANTDDVSRQGNAAGICKALQTSQVNIRTGRKDVGPGNLRVQNGGFRFTNVTVSRGATINSAIWQGFQTGDLKGTPTLVVQAEAVDNAATFTGTCADFDNRATTTASVNWTPGTGLNQFHSSSDLKTIIQEIVDRPGWASGNALVIFIQWNGTDSEGNYRTWETLEGNPTNVPKLDITFTPPGVTGGGPGGGEDVGGPPLVGDPSQTGGRGDSGREVGDSPPAGGSPQSGGGGGGGREI
ncbi:hypothetical protein IIA95_03660 [Patescibacteria group bacterium]|nr:hypothetical protein [Patescibacteria group bacterium]